MAGATSCTTYANSAARTKPVQSTTAVAGMTGIMNDRIVLNTACV